jgi:putative membrane protein
MNTKNIFPKILLLAYVIVFIWGAINPYDRAVWWVENIPIMVIVAYLVYLYRQGTVFSNLGYALMAVLPIWHTIGGHYTFERVPFDWFNDLFGYSRNMYDRIGHFSVGFFAAGFIEYFYNIKNKMSFGLSALFAFCIIGTVAGVYEIVEWIYAVKEGGSAGLAFLGSQGDIWDAQKDMGLDMLGGLFAIIILWIREKLSSKDY